MKTFTKYLSFCFLILFFSCVNEPVDLSIPNGEDPTPILVNFEENFGSQVTADFFGRIVDEDKMPLEGVSIIIGSTTTTTDAFGIFSIKDANAFENFAYITARKAGYIDGSRSLVPSITEVNQVEIMLLKEDITATISSGVIAEVNLGNGASVTFDGNFQTENGAEYNGDVKVVLKHLNPDDSDMTMMMPGMLFAQNSNGGPVALETYGMLAVELFSIGDESLQLADNSTAQIKIPLPNNTINPPTIMPLWNFDDEKGYWIEEGEATLEGNFYIGSVSHFSFWNYDFPYPSINLCITLQDTNGNLLPNTALDLYSELLNITGTYGYTNNAGVECGLVPADEELTVSVYSSLCQNSPFTTTIGPFSSDTNTTIIVELENNVTLSGTFLDCDGNAIENGYVQFFVNGQSQLIPVSNGAIDYTFNSCGASDYSLTGIDLENDQSTEVITGTIDANTTTIDLGEFSACTAFDDADNDSIADVLEDVDGDGNLDNDDTDGDSIPNYLDEDDDNDGINTINEDYDGDNDPTNDDTDDDGIANYLDANDLNLFDAETGGNGCEPVTYDFGALFANIYNVPNTDYVFYETEADATSEINSITLPYTLPFADAVLNPTIFVKATSSITGQTRIASTFLFLNYLDTDNDGLTDCEEITGIDDPSTNLVPTGISDENDPNDPNNVVTSPNDGLLEVCDDNNDGFAEFNLSSMDAFYLNGNDPSIFQISYHLTEADAFNDVSPLPILFTNTTNPQILHVRIFDNNTGNLDIALLTLEVNESPIIPADLSLTECDVNADGLAAFNLSTIDTQIADENPNNDVIITYYNSQADAESGVNPIDSAGFSNTDVSSQTLFIRVENIASGCVSLGDVSLVVDTGC
ncbi:hypothetical protein BTO05_08715 [Winogradskyella sp. PC-19]|uniref:hypothetical protein n=1 Tax=unclassified Winogradskyella TaxID=2615021 RepID=UPI000B3D3B7C|nr:MULTISPECIES: hypothetical protein [unclassified Winogradskyella]ARV09720.1 hypothetical protein BTO05_08715 [Winogradskyella sp. PC-19]RZN81395.1 MAG: hypothetical protein EVB12_03805 [Winogradskyella sp.]